jgi:hypothetical protein
VGATFHAWAAEDYAEQLEKTEDGRNRLAEYRERLTQPDMRPVFDAIGQTEDDHWTAGQVATAGRVHDLLVVGQLKAILIRVNHAPSRPTDLEADRVALAGLSDLFTTLVHDRIDDAGNGLIAWGPSIAHQIPGGWAKSAALVIGHTDPSRTLLHLTDKGVVVRWPYGSQDLWVFGFDKFTTWVEWRDESFAHLLGDGADDQ